MGGPGMKFLETLGLSNADFIDLKDAAAVDYPGWAIDEILGAIQAKILDLVDFDAIQEPPPVIAQAVIDMAAAVTAAACLTAPGPPPDFIDGFMHALDDIAQNLTGDNSGDNGHGL